jgi:hypothetical protein
MADLATKAQAPQERRRAERAALRLNATIREPGRSRVGVRLIDISTRGCRIEATCTLSPDTWLLLSIGGLETQYCRVVWHCHEFAGLEFGSALAEPVLERLLHEHKNLTESSIKELRDIAQRTFNLAAKQRDGEGETLAELSRKCAVEAVVEGLRLGEAQSGQSGS